MSFKMFIRYCFICAFICTATAEPLQYVGVIGDSIVLPCSSSNNEHSRHDIGVRWRQNGSVNVYDIIGGKYSEDHQDPRYKNRVETFPVAYEKGNFSLKLKKLIHTDAGKHQCFITHSFEAVTIQLTIQQAITESKEKLIVAAEEENQGAETRPKMMAMFLMVGINILMTNIKQL